LRFISLKIKSLVYILLGGWLQGFDKKNQCTYLLFKQNFKIDFNCTTYLAIPSKFHMEIDRQKKEKKHYPIDKRYMSTRLVNMHANISIDL
jgi:hypothetical protein